MALGYAGKVLLDEPVAYWRLGETEGTTAVDETGNGHDGTYGGGFTLGQPSLIDDEGDAAVLFDRATTGRVDLVDHADWDTTEITLEVWAKTSLDAVQMLVIRDDQDGIRMYQFRINAASQGNGFQLSVRPGIGNVVRYTPDPGDGLNDGEVHHLVGNVDDSDNMRLYLDGVLVAGPVLTTQGLVATDYPPTIAARLSQGSYDGNEFDGVLDEVAFYDYALSAERVLAHYEAGVPDA